MYLNKQVMYPKQSSKEVNKQNPPKLVRSTYVGSQEEKNWNQIVTGKKHIRLATV
jgi:hypothetical protein